ncbi:MULTISPECIES: DUF4349 domain-containing protein [unclassified Microbacterium]|uniref:DUF4349 domain-containing protein n=1 Tax=unclassified Microbacterium TaxID=2609290 RepID=UPI0016053E49|nr:MULTISPECIES: DUF4349 domain-containing protein [unclassified Microbacterium]QNA92500.1 DUF4349 domain-containing protein [Microbacterium sp. Se63.02b]QYM65797.1 DUF4349 domain-containing protein [Microbacterium sp. Se5.02b]
MNDQIDDDSLPELSEEKIARIESAVFAEIAAERPRIRPEALRARTRRRRWLTAGGIAAAFVIGVLVTPPILGAVGGGGSVTADGMSMPGGVSMDSSSGGTAESAPEVLPGSVSDSAIAGSVDADREIIATAQATVQVKSIPDAASAIGALAEEHGGYVESTEIGKSVAVDGTSNPAPADSSYGWISIRVPSADLPEVVAALRDTGDVLSSSTSKQDVTAISIDLQARVDSTRASVERLTELMAQSGSVSELIEAEVALTDRQAQLESYEQQLESLQDQVAMSSLQVQLTREATATTADPAGFTDGLLAGWNGLVASLNALVIALGFILPWLAIAAVVVLIVWLFRRARRNAGNARASAEDTSADQG